VTHWWLPMDRWPTDIVPIVSAIRTTSGWLSKKKDLSRVGLIVEGQAWNGRLLITTLNLDSKLDESYPEALFLFDRLLRCATSPEFAPHSAIPASVLDDMVVR